MEESTPHALNVILLLSGALPREFSPMIQSVCVTLGISGELPTTDTTFDAAAPGARGRTAEIPAAPKETPFVTTGVSFGAKGVSDGAKGVSFGMKGVPVGAKRFRLRQRQFRLRQREFALAQREFRLAQTGFPVWRREFRLPRGKVFHL